ncbi:hypothetical protein MMC10_009767 [Thelotrema lepadinum]|nr:hypothetical protein [Thelotrema lepadinum]
MLALTVGHEVIGKVVKTGPKVTTLKVGDLAGVGAQVYACLECQNCKNDNENYCPHQISTYGDPYPDGYIAQGGFASHIRCHEYFAFPIPDSIPAHEAAPMLCAGITTYSPLVRANVGPGKTVGVVGIGGLGHFALLWASALGAEVYALSHTANKEQDALSLGAKHFVNTTEKDWAKPLAFKFDFILNCADRTDKFNMADYFSTLKVNGHFHNVGLPDAPLPQLKAQDFAGNGCYIGSSHIGSRPEMLNMLKLAANMKLKPIIETLPVSEAGCKEGVEKVNENKVRYRFTLVDFDKAFPNRS